MKTRTPLKWIFWIVLVLFLSWDWVASPVIDLRQEPPAIALGSGKAPVGGHCAIAQ